MKRKVACGHLLGLALIVPAAAQAPPENPPPAEPVAESFGDLSARVAVRRGNTKLLEGDAASALDAYAHAAELRPNAPQIPFAQGLAHLANKEYDAARDAFRAVAASNNERLANDALYSLGASYHLEAMENSENPELAVEKLESAMARYREVLANAPNHAAARESDHKAAAMRRQLKLLLEQQQQQQQDQQGDQDEQEKDQQESDQEKQEGDQQKNDDEKQDEQQQSSEQNQEEGDEQQQQQQSADESNEKSEEQKQQQAQKSAEEEISREQAERQLREMMQAIRERQKKRKSDVRKIPLPPVERDW